MPGAEAERAATEIIREKEYKPKKGNPGGTLERLEVEFAEGGAIVTCHYKYPEKKGKAGPGEGPVSPSPEYHPPVKRVVSSKAELLELLEDKLS